MLENSPHINAILRKRPQEDPWRDFWQVSWVVLWLWGVIALVAWVVR